MTISSLVRRYRNGARATLLIAGLIFCLIGSPIAGIVKGNLASAAQTLRLTVEQRQTQWIIYIGFLVYLLVFAGVAWLQRAKAGKKLRANFWLLMYTVAFSTYAYFTDYRTASNSTEALVLLGGFTVALGAGAWRSCEPEELFVRDVVFVLQAVVFVLFIGGLYWGNFARRIAFYHGQARWSGLWKNPNLSGLLMAAGAILALGLLMREFQMTSISNKTCEPQRAFVKAMLAIAAIVMLVQMCRTFSRGACLGYCMAFAKLLLDFRALFLQKCKRLTSFVRHNLKYVCLAVLALFLAAFYEMPRFNSGLICRMFAASSDSDLSSRNRLAAWEASMQIIADHPIFGVGWNQPIMLYKHYYLPAKLDDPMAIDLNDYLMLAATLGIPILAFFALYLNRYIRHENAPGATLDVASGGGAIGRVCHATVIVLLVGFCLDGGLFQLPTATLFWIVLEVGGGI